MATDFAPSAMVARMVGVDEFAMGSTLAFRREDLERIGGFAAMADYLADDYQLGHRIHALGLKCVLSDVMVETHLGGGWRRCGRTRCGGRGRFGCRKFGGYLGLPVTNATLWAVVAAAFGHWQIWRLSLLALRMAMAIAVGLVSAAQPRRAVPVGGWRRCGICSDYAVWVAGLFGNAVVWRGRRLALDREGRIHAD